MEQPLDILPSRSSVKPACRELNGLLLASALLYVFGSGNLNNVYNDIYVQAKGENSTLWYSFITIVCTAGAAVLSDLTGTARLLNITGMAMLIGLNTLTFFSDTLTGYPLMVLFELAQGFVFYPLVKRLIFNTQFFGRPQKIILLGIAGVHLFLTFFRMSFRVMHIDYDYLLRGEFLISTLVLLIAFILLLVENRRGEHEENSRDLTRQNPQLWTRFILPLVLVSLVTTWAVSQTNRVYLYAQYLEHGNTFTVIVSFIGICLTFGLLALLVMVFSVKQHWVYIGTGAVLLSLLIVAFAMGLYNSENENRWLLEILNRIGTSLTSFGLSLWIYRYSQFSFLALLLTLPVIADYIAFIAIDYFDIRIYEPFIPG